MKRINRRSFLALSGGVAGIALVGCGGDDDDAAAATATGSNGGPVSLTTAASASPPALSSPSASAATPGTPVWLTSTVIPENKGPIEFTNVSYDPTRELYAVYGPLFEKHWKTVAGVDVKVSTSNGGSGSQARSVIDGLEADVVTLAVAADTNAIQKAGLIHGGWESEFPNNSNPYVSTIVLLVRKGNPKGITCWADLAKSGIGVITPNPKTSGGARWNFLAAWASVTQSGGTADQARTLVQAIYKNVKVLDSGARGSTQTFVEKKIGDVLIAWENEALLATRDSQGFEIVYPKHSILAEPSVAVVDKVVDKRKTRQVAHEFLAYLYSDEAQELIARNFYRPNSETVLAKYSAQFPKFEKLATIRDFGGWDRVQTEYFADGAVFDQVYKP